MADVANETNAMIVRAEPGELIFDDLGAVLTTTAPQCAVVAAHQVRCDSTGVSFLSALLGSGNDVFRLDDSSSTVAVSAFIDGGPGQDRLEAGAGDDLVSAGDGNDIVDEGRGTTG